MKVGFVLLVVISSVVSLPTAPGPEDLPILIPDTKVLDSDVLHSAGADKFLTLWHINVLSGSVMVSDEPWTVLVPLNSGLPKDPSFILDKERSREMLLNHVILGDIVTPDLAAADPTGIYYSLADTQLNFSKKGDATYVNGIKLTGQKFDYSNGVVYLIEKTIPVSTPDYLKYVPAGDLFDSFNSVISDKKSKQLSGSGSPPIQPEATTEKAAPKATRFDRFRTPKKDTGVKTTTAAPTTEATTEANAGFLENFFGEVGPSSPSEEFNVAVTQQQNETFLESLQQEAEIPDSIASEFIHHLLDVGLDLFFKKDNKYTAVIPTDDAFYDYYPIDWGFNPFSVENFTKNVLLNHIIDGDVNLHKLSNGTQLTTLGGSQLKLTTLEGGRIEINGHLIPPEFEFEVPKGRIYYVDTLFFVDYDRVNQLKEEYPYLESGPLISFPWPTAPFLSHLVRRLQEKSSANTFQKLLVKSSIAPLVTSSDSNLQRVSYTVFIPSEAAIQTVFTPEELAYVDDETTENSAKISMIDEKKLDKFLLDHIFPGYLFEKDLKNSKVLTALSDKKAIITRSNGQIEINGAPIVGEQQYLYNLGGIFFIDGTLSESMELSTETIVTTTESENPGMSVPFPAELMAALKFPAEADPSVRFETRTEISFSKQINNGEIIPITRDEVDQIKRNLL